MILCLNILHGGKELKKIKTHKILVYINKYDELKFQYWNRI